MAGKEEERVKPLRRIAKSFKELADSLKDSSDAAAAVGDLDVGPFSLACSHVSVLFSSLGIAFKFAQIDYVAKVDDLSRASNSISTLQSLLEKDIRQDTVRKAGSHSRNLLRVKRGLDMVKVLFEQILASNDNSLKDAASVAYAQVFAAHHNWAIRKAVAAGMYALPTRTQLLEKLNEDETSARAQMQEYISASTSVILYINDMFISRELGIDWLRLRGLSTTVTEESRRLLFFSKYLRIQEKSWAPLTTMDTKSKCSITNQFWVTMSVREASRAKIVVPLSLEDAKEPPIKRIVGPNAPGGTCHITIDHGGNVPYWEGQSYGVIPPETIVLKLIKTS